MRVRHCSPCCTLGVVPIINENDTVVTDEIKFGDNDTLGALVANLIEGDALIILTDQRGLFTADPRKDPAAEFVHEAKAGDLSLEAMAGGAGSSLGRGGMLTKILAAKRAALSGAHTVIAWGREENVLTRLAQGEAYRYAIDGADRATDRAQAMDGGSFADGGQNCAGRRRGDEADRRRQIAAADRRDWTCQGDFGRGDVITCIDAIRPRDRARHHQLRQFGNAPHHAQTIYRDCIDSRVCRRA